MTAGTAAVNIRAYPCRQAVFEQAKAEMESALGKHIESLLQKSKPISKGKAA